MNDISFISTFHPKEPLQISSGFVKGRFHGTFPASLVLISPTGKKTAVLVVKKLRNEEYYLAGEGWNSFVRDHSLEKSDILYFEHRGNGIFDVKVHDRLGCSKPHLKKPKMERNKTPNDSDQESDETPKQKKRKPSYTRKQGNDNEGIKAEKLAQTSEKLSYARKRMFDLDGVYGDDAAYLDASSSRKSLLPLNMIMTRTYIDDGYVQMPAHFCKQFKASGAIQARLKVSDGWWDMKYSTGRYTDGRCRGRLFSGWLKFVEDNGLKIGDACFFKFLSKDHSLLVMEVTLSRESDHVRCEVD